jgi:hypothetical protein
MGHGKDENKVYVLLEQLDEKVAVRTSRSSASS